MASSHISTLSFTRNSQKPLRSGCRDQARYPARSIVIVNVMGRTGRFHLKDCGEKPAGLGENRAEANAAGANAANRQPRMTDGMLVGWAPNEPLILKPGTAKLVKRAQSGLPDALRQTGLLHRPDSRWSRAEDTGQLLREVRAYATWRFLQVRAITNRKRPLHFVRTAISGDSCRTCIFEARTSSTGLYCPMALRRLC
jgi:hypothetical protein